MPRSARVPLLLLAVFALAAPGHAQAPPPPTDSTGQTEAATPPAPARASKRDRAISGNLASSLAASMPKYNPPPKPKPEDDDVDLREVDKPKNGIIRLPKYTVQEKKPPVFRERDIFNRAGFAALAQKRYLSNAYRALNSFTLPLFGTSPEDHALAMYAEDERLQNMSDLKSTARDVGVTNPADAAALRKATNDTYQRTSDFGFEPKDQKRQ